MEEQYFMLEYSEQQGCFHMNPELSPGVYARPLRTNGFRPILRLSASKYHEEWFQDIINKFNGQKESYYYVSTYIYRQINKHEISEEMQHYTKEEMQKMMEMKNAGKPYAEIASLLGRTEDAIRLKIQYMERKLNNNEPKPKRTYTKTADKQVADNNSAATATTELNAKVNTAWVQTPTKELSPRQMIRKLYDLGYRIENNQLVCYVKSTVNLKDIISETV